MGLATVATTASTVTSPSQAYSPSFKFPLRSMASGDSTKQAAILALPCQIIGAATWQSGCTHVSSDLLPDCCATLNRRLCFLYLLYDTIPRKLEQPADRLRGPSLLCFALHCTAFLRLGCSPPPDPPSFLVRGVHVRVQSHGFIMPISRFPGPSHLPYHLSLSFPKWTYSRELLHRSTPVLLMEMLLRPLQWIPSCCYFEPRVMPHS